MEDKVLLGHGSGGTMMRRIIDEVFFEAYAGDELRRGDDAAVLPELPEGARLAFSTDSFVVTPHFLPWRRHRASRDMRNSERHRHERCQAALSELRLHPRRRLSHR